MIRMPTRFRHAVIVGKYQALGIRPLLEEIAHFLRRHWGWRCRSRRPPRVNTGVTDYDALTPAQMGQRCDLAVVVGGDGTMLGIGRELARHDLPLVGINQGRLGFITDVPVDQFREALEPMVAGDYEEEHRAMIEGGIWRDGEKIFDGLSMNDVVVSRGATASMVELRIEIGDEFVANLRADGLIVAIAHRQHGLCAVGRRADPAPGHRRAAAGADRVAHAVQPADRAARRHSEIRIEVVAGRDASANFDMQSLASLLHGDQVRVRRSAHKVRFLHPRGWSYYATLRRKLRWHEGVV